MAKIKMVQGHPVEVDDDIYELYGKFQWTLQKDWYVAVKIGKKKYNLARLIMNAPDHLVVDHIDRNIFNNKRENLRLATISQNNANRKYENIEKTSKYHGVFFRQQKRVVKGKEYVYDYWWAQVKLNGKIVYREAFKTEDEAARARDKAAKEIYGEFAVLNFPESTVQPSIFNV